MTDLSQPLPGIPWYDVSDPNSPALNDLARQFGLHELQVDDCRNLQRAKTEEFERYSFTVLKRLEPGEATRFSDFDVFLGKDFLITVHRGDSPELTKALERARQENVQRLDKLFYILSDHVVDGYLLALDDIADMIAAIESSVLESPEPAVLQKVFRLKRDLIEFRRHAGGMREVVNHLMRREGGLLGDDLDPYFRDIYDHIVRTVDLIETYRDLLTGAMDIYLSAVANRTNEIVKVLTIWGTVALPLIVVTGFFGMNLALPWQHTSWGAVYAGSIMLGMVGLVLWYFRKKHWF